MVNLGTVYPTDPVAEQLKRERYNEIYKEVDRSLLKATTLLPNDSIEGWVIVEDKNWEYLNKNYDKYLVTVPFGPDQYIIELHSPNIVKESLQKPKS